MGLSLPACLAARWSIHSLGSTKNALHLSSSETNHLGALFTHNACPSSFLKSGCLGPSSPARFAWRKSLHEVGSSFQLCHKASLSSVPPNALPAAQLATLPAALRCGGTSAALRSSGAAELRSPCATGGSWSTSRACSWRTSRASISARGFVSGRAWPLSRRASFSSCCTGCGVKLSSSLSWKATHSGALSSQSAPPPMFLKSGYLLLTSPSRLSRRKSIQAARSLTKLFHKASFASARLGGGTA
mmetsp:Transcript_21167/g.49195  ORF Transcript_21167/g.49195 Transcript_21167/m.49195 type:complete len:245 (-) Transcript_21167:223-957(-)